MYLCNQCHHVFDEPAHRIIVDPNMGSAAYMVQPVEVCPVCYHDDITEAAHCILCGDIHDTVSMCSWNEDICVKCMTGLMSKVRNLLRLSLPTGEYEIIQQYLDLDAKIA